MTRDVSRENNMVMNYLRLLQKWNKHISLVSRKSTKETLHRMVGEINSALSLLKPKHKLMYDFGSGNGLPGVLLAISRPDANVVLVERSSKKCLFLEAVVRELKLDNTRVVNASFEEVDVEGGQPTMITSIGLDFYQQIYSLLWPALHAGDSIFLFVNKELAAQIASHVSCGTYWWQPLPDNNISGIALFEK